MISLQKIYEKNKEQFDTFIKEREEYRKNLNRQLYEDIEHNNLKLWQAILDYVSNNKE